MYNIYDLNLTSDLDAPLKEALITSPSMKHMAVKEPTGGCQVEAASVTAKDV